MTSCALIDFMYSLGFVHKNGNHVYNNKLFEKNERKVGQTITMLTRTNYVYFSFHWSLAVLVSINLRYPRKARKAYQLKWYLFLIQRQTISGDYFAIGILALIEDSNRVLATFFNKFGWCFHFYYNVRIYYTFFFNGVLAKTEYFIRITLTFSSCFRYTVCF